MPLTYSIEPHGTNKFCTVTFTNIEVSNGTNNKTSEQTFQISYPLNKKQAGHWTCIFKALIKQNTSFEDHFAKGDLKTQMYVDPFGFIIVEIVTDSDDWNPFPMKCKYRCENNENEYNEFAKAPFKRSFDHMLFSDKFFIDLHNSSPFITCPLIFEQFQYKQD